MATVQEGPERSAVMYPPIAQWRRARDSTNLGYPQVPGSIPAENQSTQISMDLST